MSSRITQSIFIILLVIILSSPAFGQWFDARRDFVVGDLPYSLGLGDFNSDGLVDVVTANKYGNDVSILWGTGDGTFQFAFQRSLSGSANSVAIGDLDGYGTVQSPLFLASTDGQRSMAVHDLDDDGAQDLVVAARGVAP